jgi:hypothetical protein
MPKIEDLKLVISVGPNYQDLVKVEYNKEAILVNSEHFCGYIFVRIHDNDPNNAQNETYFKGKKRKYAMSIQGRFKQSYGGDELLFGGDFDSPMKPPPGTSIAIRIAKFLDPAIVANGSDNQPYMFSPLLTAMNSLQIMPVNSPFFESPTNDPIKTVSVSSSKPLELPAWSFQQKLVGENTDLIVPTKHFTTYTDRKTHFLNVDHRQQVLINPDHVYCMDFYDAYFDIKNASVKLPGFSLSVLNYWNGKQKLRYSLVNRDRTVVFFCIQFEYVSK